MSRCRIGCDPASVDPSQDRVKLDIAERRLPKRWINLQFEGQSIDVRVATVPTVEGESVSLRLLNGKDCRAPRNGGFRSLKIKSILSLPNGIILITGPAGRVNRPVSTPSER